MLGIFLNSFKYFSRYFVVMADVGESLPYRTAKFAESHVEGLLRISVPGVIEESFNVCLKLMAGGADVLKVGIGLRILWKRSKGVGHGSPHAFA